jgi:hypothetical protein
VFPPGLIGPRLSQAQSPASWKRLRNSLMRRCFAALSDESSRSMRPCEPLAQTIATLGFQSFFAT